MTKKELIAFANKIAEARKAEVRNEEIKVQRRTNHDKRRFFSTAEISLGLHLSHLGDGQR